MERKRESRTLEEEEEEECKVRCCSLDSCDCSIWCNRLDRILEDGAVGPSVMYTAVGSSVDMDVDVLVT